MESQIKKNYMGEITEVNGIVVHTYANIVTLEPNIDSLADSIKRTGLLHPVLMYQGQILDGRRRVLACGSIGVEPSFHDIGYDSNGNKIHMEDKKLYEIVLAENNRRNLVATQRAIVAARETIKGNHKNTPYTKAEVYAKIIWDVSKKTLEDAKWIVKNYPGYADILFEGNKVEIGNKMYGGVSGLRTAIVNMERAPIDKDASPQMAAFIHHTKQSIEIGLNRGLEKDDMVKAFKDTIDKIGDAQ